jgi:hypothetical protein
MQFKVFEGINSVDQATWSQITRGHPYAGWRWCQYGEVTLNRQGHYLVAYEGDEPVGGAIFWVMHKEAIPSRNPWVRWFLKVYLKRRPLVVCRTPVLTDHKGFFLPPDPAQQAAVLDEIKRLGIEIIRKNKGSFLLADYLVAEEVDYDWGDFLKLKDFLNIGTRMNIEWETFDEYMAALKAQNKKAHKNVRHNIRYAQEAGITLRSQQVTPPVDDIIRLYVTKMKHYKVPYEVTWIRRIITNAVPLLPEQSAVWVLAYLDDKMVGCELLLHDAENRICKPVLYGRDYTAEHVYFYMSYEDIRYAIETMRAKTIIYDTEAYDFKRRMGFTLDSRNNLVLYPNSRLERTLAGWLAGYMND